MSHKALNPSMHELLQNHTCCKAIWTTALLLELWWERIQGTVDRGDLHWSSPAVPSNVEISGFSPHSTDAQWRPYQHPYCNVETPLVPCTHHLRSGPLLGEQTAVIRLEDGEVTAFVTVLNNLKPSQWLWKNKCLWTHMNMQWVWERDDYSKDSGIIWTSSENSQEQLFKKQ